MNKLAGALRYLVAELGPLIAFWALDFAFGVERALHMVTSTARKFSPSSIHSIRCAGRSSIFSPCATTGAATACLMQAPMAGCARCPLSGPMFSNPTS